MGRILSGGAVVSVCVLALAFTLAFPAEAGAGVASVPFHDDFDYPVLGPWWSASGTAPTPMPPPQPVGWWYRLLSAFAPPSGTWHMVLDSSTAGTNNRNEVTLTVDLAGKSHVYLSFLAKSFSDTPNPLTPWAPYTGSKDFDGVAVSPDGTTWYPVLTLTEDAGLTRSYARYSVDLDGAVAAWSLSYTGTFQIRFNHYGSGQVVSETGTGGIGIDDVSVREVPPLTDDFGDAPAPYATLLADNGARHTAVGPMLGTARDTESDGQPDVDATGDGGDEDGVVFPDPLIPGHAATILVACSQSAFLNGWADWNTDGDWNDPGEQWFADRPLNAGDNTLTVLLPADAQVSDRVFARFRVGTAAGLSFGGAASDGEVEDYRLTVVPASPVMNAEPALTAGTENTVSWLPVPQAELYYVECAQASDFGDIFQASGWTPALSQTFVGLWDVTQYYRVKAARSFAGGDSSWTQTEDAEFALGTQSGTALYGGGAVSLLGPVVRTDTVGGASENLKGTSTNTGRFNVFSVSKAVRLTGFSMLLSRHSAMNVEFAVYEGETNLGGFGWTNTCVYSKSVPVEAGMGFLSTDGLSLTLVPGKYYALGLTWSGTVNTYKAPAPTPVSFGGNVGLAQSTQYPAGSSLPMSQPYNVASGMYYMHIQTDDGGAYAPSGDIVSPVINPDPWFAWRTLNYSAETPSGTAIAVDILPETGSTPVPGWSNLAPGADLRALPAMPVRLRARLSTSNTAVTPALRDWEVTWQSEPDRRVESAWSDPVASTQDGLSPHVVSVTPIDASPARTPTVRFLVQYSESVTGVRTSAPFADFAVRTGSVPGASIVSVTQAGDPSRYEVTVATGNANGMLALDALAGGAVQDQSGNALSAGFTSGAAYTLDYTAPTVAGVARLDPSPSNAPAVRFLVTFSEPVTGVPTAAPFTGFNTTGLTGTSVSSISGTGAAYTVTVRTGAWDGTLRLAVGTTGPVKDAAGWPLAAGMVSPSPYQMSHLRFTAVPDALTTLKSGEPCRMAVAVAGGTGARSYQWHRDGAAKEYEPVDGATSPVLDISRVWIEDEGWYYCEVADAHETIQSPPARLEVQAVLPAAGAGGLALAAALLTFAGARATRSVRLYPFRRTRL